MDGKESQIAVYLKKAPPIEQGSDYLLEEGNLPYNQEEQHPIRLVLRGENLKAQYADAKNPGRELLRYRGFVSESRSLSSPSAEPMPNKKSW